MRKVQLGRSDLMVTQICFGCWQLSPTFWGEVDLKPWQDSVKAALDCGVNFIDTADAYGDGYAESCLGDYLADNSLRDDFVIATKFYWNFEQKARHPDTSYDYIMRECEASLKRLKTDRIDLYQIHAWDPLTRPDEVAAAFDQLRRQGKVRWFGVSNLNDIQMSMYQDHFDIQCLQPCYNILQRDIEARELPYCLKEKVGVIAYSPLANGILAGKYDKETKFDDFRKDNPMYQGGAFEAMLGGIDKLRKVGEDLGLSVAQLAIRWVITHPALTSAIVGVKKADHITSIVKAAEEELPIDIWHKVAYTMQAAKGKAGL